MWPRDSLLASTAKKNSLLCLLIDLATNDKQRNRSLNRPGHPPMAAYLCRSYKCNACHYRNADINKGLVLATSVLLRVNSSEYLSPYLLLTRKRSQTENFNFHETSCECREHSETISVSAEIHTEGVKSALEVIMCFRY